MTLAVGFFDGVHLGHQRILDGADSVLTFRNHPLSVLDPSVAPALLMPVGERIAMLETVGAKTPRKVCAVRFTKKFAAMPVWEFAAFLRCEFPDIEKVHCGGNWRFGANGAGTPQMLRRNFGFSVKVSRYAKCGDAVISSTAIRAALSKGDVALANAMLGRRFSVAGKVVCGKGLGRKIGAPTLNLKVSAPLRLGVYAVDTPYGRGIANYGMAPTMDGASWPEPVLEVHLLEVAAGGEIPKHGSMRVEFGSFIREERKFGGIAALRRQIVADMAAVRQGWQDDWRISKSALAKMGGIL